MIEHPIDGLMKTTMDSIKDMIDVNTIVGDPVHTNEGAVIIPISKVTIGFASGGSEYQCQEKKQEIQGKYPFGGGSGAGMSLQPIAFLVVNQDDVKLLPVNQANTVERMADKIPDLIDDIVNMFKNKKKQDEMNTDFNPS